MGLDNIWIEYMYKLVDLNKIFFTLVAACPEINQFYP